MVPKMTFNIKAHTDYDTEHPDWVTFYFGSSDDSGTGRCILELSRWLFENEIKNTVISFDTDDNCILAIPSEEARVLICLTYDMYIVPTDYDRYNDVGYLPGTSDLTLKFANLCREIMPTK
jgi:hypothetical protein